MHTMTRKGQSAIEYLTTYGWMLIVIIVAIGALMQMGIFNQCSDTQPTSVGDLTVSNWGFQDASTVQLQVQSMANEQVNVTAASWGADGSFSLDSFAEVPAGGSATLTLSGDELSAGSCATGDLTFTYDQGELTDLQSSGDRALGGTVPQ